MKLKAHLLLQVVFLLVVVVSRAQKPEPEIYKGNELYKKQQYDKANEAYQQAPIQLLITITETQTSGKTNLMMP